MILWKHEINQLLQTDKSLKHRSGKNLHSPSNTVYIINNFSPKPFKKENAWLWGFH